MDIHVRVFFGAQPLYGKHKPPRHLGDVRRAKIADGDNTMRSIKRFNAAGQKLILRVTEMGDAFHVTASERLTDGWLFSGLAQDGKPFPIRKRTSDDEWWIVLSHDETPLENSLPGYGPSGDTMVCLHDERYAQAHFNDEEGAFNEWAAIEQTVGDQDAMIDKPVRPAIADSAPSQSWHYCQEVLSPPLADLAKDGNGAIPAATVLATLQAMSACASGDTKSLIERLVGDRWSSDMSPFEILGLMPDRWSAPSYSANLATSVWVADGIEPNGECEEKIGAISAERKSIGPDLAAAENKISSWLRQKICSNFSPSIELDPLVEFVVVSAMLFKDAWMDPFERSDSERGVFFGRDGVRTIEYMRGLRDGSVTHFERCRAASLRLSSGGSVVFVLPNRETDVLDLLRSGEALAAAADRTAEQGRGTDVDWWLPKFDVTGSVKGSSEMLIPGINDNGPLADFSPMTGQMTSLVPSCASEARVKIDEEGIEASGYTLFACESAGILDEKPPVVPFVLDRPFVFALVSKTREPMFIGAVEYPEGY